MLVKFQCNKCYTKHEIDMTGKEKSEILQTPFYCAICNSSVDNNKIVIDEEGSLK